MSKRLLALALCPFIPALGYAVEVQPVVNAQLLGGQYFYQGSESALGAIANLSASPYLKFNDRWSLVPLYAGSYRGTKQVTDIVGGGTLFQDSQDHVLSLKGIRSFSNDLKIKAVGSYAHELLRETKDESWGKGLYDNHRLSAGSEAEWSWAENRYVRFAYDFYRVTFPNYESLESQGASLDLARELNEPNVLDTNNHVLSWGAQTGLPWNGSGLLSYSMTWRGFSDQHIVDSAGLLTADKRKDRVHAITAEGTWPVAGADRWKVLSTWGLSRTRLYSNQNNYDAGKTVFNPNFYAYLKHSIYGRCDLYVGENPWIVSFTWDLSRQNYADRRTQDAAGAYQSDTTRVDNFTSGLGFSYPIGKGFRVAANVYLGWSDANTHYETAYQYHYNTAAYLLGVTYAY